MAARQPLPYARELAALRREGVRADSIRVFLGPDAWDLARQWRRVSALARLPHVVLPPGGDPAAFDWRALGWWQRPRRTLVAESAAVAAISARREALGLPALAPSVLDAWAQPGLTVELIDHAPGCRGGLDGALADTVAALCLAAGCRRVLGWLDGEPDRVEWLPERVG